MEPRARAWVPFGFLAAGLVAVAFLPHSVSGDDVPRYQALSSLLRRGKVHPTNYSLVGPLFSSPLWLMGKHLGHSAERWCEAYNLLLFLLCLVALNALLRGAVPDAVRRNFLLLLLFASMFPQHLLHYGAEVFTAVLAAVGLALIAIRGSGWGWPCVILAAVNTPAVLGALAVVVGWQLFQTKRLRLLLVLAAAAGLFLLESWLRRGSLTRTGYENNVGHATLMPYSGLPGFSYPFFLGLLSILLSFGKGLVFFAPGLLLPCRRQEVSAPARSAWLLWVVLTAGLVLVYSRWWAWYGGWTWGPRFFLFASIPAAFTLALALDRAPRRGLGWNVFALLALALSFWVGYSGLAFGQQNLAICTENDFALEHLTWHVPEFSVLWRPFVETATLSRRARLVGGLYLACFVYVSYPLLRVCIDQTRERVRKWIVLHRDSGPWRL